MLLKNRLTKEQALTKIKFYCGYQERCHAEVKEKLYTYGIRKAEVEEIVSVLIESNYLNEERFATQFAGGKFRMKHWGRKKIQYELQQKKIGSFIIKMALKEIKKKDYIETLQKLAQTKWKSLEGESSITRQAKTTAYLLQKGYEQNLISATLHDIQSNER